MDAPEVNVEVVVPAVGETPPSDEPTEPVIVAPVVDGGTDPGTILSLEMLRDQVAELRTAADSARAVADAAALEIVELRNRIVDLEIEAVAEPDEPGEIVAEVIPPEPEAPAAEEKPAQRKRRFV